MTGNRHLFKGMLRASIILLSVIFLSFGILAYLRYGNRTAQSINLSVEPENGPVSIAVNITLIVGVLFTFPLQMYPVIELVETKLFGPGKPTFLVF